MAQSSWPWPDPANSNKRVVDDAQFEQTMSGGMYDGFIDGNPSTTTDPVYLSAGALKVRPSRTANVRGHSWATDTDGDDISSLVTTNSSGSPRIDLVVLRLDRSTWKVTLAVVAGTPGSGAPAATRNTGSTGVYEVEVAEATVPTGGNTVTVVKNRAWYLIRGGTIACTSTSRPPSAVSRVIWETDTGRRYAGTGSGWLLTGEDTGWVAVTGINTNWAASAAPMIRRVNGIVYLRPGELSRVSTLNSGDNSLIYTIPAGFRSSIYQHMSCYQDGSNVADVVIKTEDYGLWVRGHASPITAGSSLRISTITYPADL